MKAKVLQLLRKQQNDDYLSGEKISDILGCSRTMIWKYIDALRKEGYEILAVSNKGYKLGSETDHISKHEILSRIESNPLFKDVYYFETLESTQITAHKLVNEGAVSGTVVIADEQTSGRGRLGRQWLSSKNSGIWMSMILRPEIEMRQAPQLTLVTAIAVVRAIEAVTKINVDIKWPNDILINGKKIAGILTEMQADPDRVKSVIIGIGLNVNQPLFSEDLSAIATSLAMEKGEQFNRSELIAEILKEFQWLYDTYLTKGFSVLKPLWEAHAVTIGKRITARTPKETKTGVAEGIDEEGILMLRDDTGTVHQIYSADITLSKD